MSITGSTSWRKIMSARFMKGLVGVAALAAFGVSTQAAMIENSASVTYVGSLNAGGVSPGLNDGVFATQAGYTNSATARDQSNMFGYALNGSSTLNSITLNQATQGSRVRLETVNVYTTGGVVTYSGLADTDAVTINLTGVNADPTSFVYVEAVASQLNPGDTNIAITELEVDGTVITPWTNNLSGATGSTNGAGWNAGSIVSMVDGLTSGQAGGFYNLQVVAGGTYAADTNLQFDMGSAVTSRTFAMSMQIGNRHAINEFRLIFDDADDFATPVSTLTFFGDEEQVYQTFDLGGDVTAQYVRFELVSLHNTATAGDSNTGFTELQLFEEAIVIPEPASVALLGLGGLLIGGRRRPGRFVG